MPMRWWLPLAGPVNPFRIGLHHTHAALARWLDPLSAAMTTSDPEEEHGNTLKPWFASPVSRAQDGSFGIEVSALTHAVSDIVYAGPPQHELRLGREMVRTGSPREISNADWKDLAESTGRRRWTVAFITPTCFRMRGAAGVSPLPAIEPILRGLDNCWTAFSGYSSRLGGHQSPGVTVTRCDTETHLVSIARPGEGRMPSSVPGFVGELTFEASAESAAVVGPLFALIDYVSIGSFARRGLGLARVISTREDVRDDRRTRQPDAARRDRIRRSEGDPVSGERGVRAVG